MQYLSIFCQYLSLKFQKCEFLRWRADCNLLFGPFRCLWHIDLTTNEALHSSAWHTKSCVNKENSSKSHKIVYLGWRCNYTWIIMMDAPWNISSKFIKIQHSVCKLYEKTKLITVSIQKKPIKVCTSIATPRLRFYF